MSVFASLTGAVVCLGAAPPPARLGSTERATTPPIEAAIDRVTVFSNRARVVRVARPSLTAGVNTLRFASLPPGLITDSVRVSADGARVLRAEVSVSETERVPIASIQRQLDELEGLQQQRRAIADAMAIAKREVELVNALQPASFPSEADRRGRPLPPASLDRWLVFADFFGARAGGARRALLESRQALRPIDARIEAVKSSLRAVDWREAPRRTAEVVAVVRAAAARATAVELSYDVAGPSWRPVYDLHYAPADVELAVYTGAVVRQQTGEDWTDAAMTFSTGVPDESIALPRLLTWTLGEKRDFKPEVRPARRRPAAPAMAAPVRRRAEPSEALRAVRTRYRQLLAAASVADEERPEGGPETPKRPPPPPPPPRPPPAPRVQREASRRADAPARTFSSAASVDAEMTEQAELTGSETSGRRGRREPRLARRALALSQAGAPDPTKGLPADSPARMARGATYLYEAPARATVASDGQPVKVPVGVERFETEGFYEATPGLSTTAYLRARLTNRSTRPLLAGPTNIFVKGRFIGQGKVDTTAPQRQIELGLGADESIKISRKVLPATREEGLFSKRSVTRYRVVIEVANHHRRPVAVELLEPIPQSKKDDIEIEVVSLTPKPIDGPDAAGIVRFGLSLPAGAKRTVELVYEIDRPADFELRQN